jgi:hypothetical protein
MLSRESDGLFLVGDSALGTIVAQLEQSIAPQATRV